MVALKKLLKDFKNEHILGIVGLIILVGALYNYSLNKNIFQLGMTPLNSAPLQTNQPETASNVAGASNATTYAPYNGASQSQDSTSVSSAASMNKPIANPTDLLPNGSGSWGEMNPVGDLKNINLLNPSQVVGINTQGSSLRNANLQLRSEPANPRTTTNSPWNISTIEEDKFRKPLEIG